VVWAGGRAVLHGDEQGLRGVGLGRVEGMRRVREDDESRQLRAQRDGRSGLRIAGNPGKAPVVCGDDLHEEVDVGVEVPPAETPFSELDQEIVARVPMELVAKLLVASRPVL